MCLGAIYWARPDKVVFGATKQDAANAQFDDQFIYDELETELSRRHIQFENMMRDEAREVFDAWKKKEDKKEY
jgi:tRNA(Arg) A34 adenosine deaminase TadA